MSADLDPRLRAALHDLADVPAPELPAAVALAGVRRHRRRLAAAVLVGVAAGTAIALSLPTDSPPSGPAPEVGTSATSPGR
jgi:hypothetical protein